MTIKVYGVDPSIDESHWSKLMRIMGDAGASMAVGSGLKVTVATGTRLVNVAAGSSIQAGTLVESDAPVSKTLASNGGSNPRIDVIAVQVDWTGTVDTGGTVVVVQGAAAANPVAPALTQTSGVLWQTPLAYVTVAPAAGQLVAGNVADVRPGLQSTATNVSFPGNYADDTTVPMYVQRSSTGIVEYGGRFKRITTNAAAGTTLTQNNVIPVGYRPATKASTLGVGGVISGPVVYVLLEANTDGSVDITPLTSALTTNTTVRINTVHWIGA